MSFGKVLVPREHYHFQVYSASHLHPFADSEGDSVSPQVELRTIIEYEPTLLLASIPGRILSRVVDLTIHNTPYRNTSSLRYMSNLQNLTLRKLRVSEVTKILLTESKTHGCEVGVPTPRNEPAIPHLRNMLQADVDMRGEIEEIASMSGEFIDVLERRRQYGVGLSRIISRRCGGWTEHVIERLRDVVENVQLEGVEVQSY